MWRMSTPTPLRLTALAAVLAVGAAAPAASAKDGDGRVIKAGSCSAGATSKLKVKPDDGRLEVEFEVDRNRAGETWRVTLSRGGAVLARGTGRTAGASGSFSFERRVSAGAGRITAKATGPGGRTCTASVTPAS